MATIQLPIDFKEFFLSLNSHRVDYLLIGGYAVAYYGFPRYTGDIDVWVGRSIENANRTFQTLQDFGFSAAGLDAEYFQKSEQILRMGVPPLRIEILTSISGLEFENAYKNRVDIELDGVPIHLISLDDLKKNKASAGRLKDLHDLKNLP